MDQVIRQNAALVEEAAAAAESLSDQAASLEQLVNAFTIEGGPSNLMKAATASAGKIPV